MSPDIQIVVTFAFFLVLLGCGMAVPFAIAVPAMFYLLLQGGLPSLNSLGLVSWGSMNSFVLTCVPLFMLMAEILRVSGLSSRIYSGLAKLVAKLPGGLLQTNIAGCAIFASVSGSSIATAASIGGVALPQLLRRNYDRRLAAGSLAAGGTLGILLPPSFGMIVYGTLEFFLALFLLYTVLGCLIESLGMIVITVPLIFPILPSYGIDPLLFGVVLVLFVELGQISPPIGINLFVIQSIWDGKLSEVILGTIPFHLTMFVVLALVIVWPDLALWLPYHASR